MILELCVLISLLSLAAFRRCPALLCCGNQICKDQQQGIALLLSLRKKTINSELVSSANIDFAIHDDWNSELDERASAIAILLLRAVVQFAGQVVCVVGVQNGRVAQLMIHLQRPHD